MQPAQVKALLQNITQPACLIDQNLNLIDENTAFGHTLCQLQLNNYKQLTEVIPSLNPSLLFEYLTKHKDEPEKAPYLPISAKQGLYLKLICWLSNQNQYIVKLKSPLIDEGIIKILASLPGNFVIYSPENKILVAQGLGLSFANQLPPPPNINNLSNTNLVKDFLSIQNKSFSLHYQLFSAPNLPKLIWLNIMDQTSAHNLQLRLIKNQQQAQDQLTEKNTFVASIVHEIRNPLHLINGHAHLLQQTTLKSQQKELVNTITTQTSKLKYLLNDLTNNQAHQEFTYQPSVINVGKFTEQIFKQQKKEIETNGLTCLLKINNQIGQQQTHIDPIRYEQIWTNLISNAIKNTPKGNTIGIKATISKNKQAIKIAGVVADNGNGIAKEKQKNIFDAFYSHATQKHHHSSLGLGLNICDKIIKRMQGTIRVKSTPQKGSVFLFTIYAPAQTKFTKPTIQPHQSPKPHLLIADDNTMNLFYVKQVLGNHAHITMVQTAQQAMEAFQIQNYDCVFLDINLPDQSGYQLANELQRIATKNNQKTKIVALTGEQEPLNHPFEIWLKKPIGPELLKKAFFEFSTNLQKAKPTEK